MSVQYPYIAIEGVIGVGKTTLARMLGQRFRGGALLEAFDANPFLSNFYGDRARYAFQTQLFFLLSRYRQQQTVPAFLGRGALFSDYCFEKDKLFAHLNMAGDELDMYDRLYDALSEKVQPPDLVVYLRAEVDTLMARITMRDRPYERQMDRDYIAALRQGYETLFAAYNSTPLLVIETDALDFVVRPTDFEAIEQRIRAQLSGVRQPSLPDLPWMQVARAAEPAARLPQGTAPTVEYGPALSDFLVLSEAVGRLGGALAQSQATPVVDVLPRIRSGIQDAERALASLAQCVGSIEGIC